MKKFIFIAIFAVVSFLVFAEETYFYRYGKKVELLKDENFRSKSLFPIYKIKSSGKPLYSTGKVFVKFKENLTETEKNEILKKFGLSNPETFYMLDSWVLAKSEKDPVETSKKIYESSLVLASEPSFEIEIEQYSYQNPDDTYFSKQWYIGNAGIQDAWIYLSENGTIPGKGIKVAVIDDGFDINHEDFEGKFAGWKDTGSGATAEMYNPKANKHGTACAGIIGAKINNGKGVAGVCAECQLVAIRYNASVTVDSLAITTFAEAMKFEPDVISCSWGPKMTEPANNPTFGQPVQEMLDNAAKNGRNGKGTVIVFAVGNDNYDFTTNNGFATNKSVLAVGACDSEGYRTNYSNYGNSLSILAPSTKGFQAAGDGIFTVDNYFFEQGNDTAGYNFYSLNNGDKEGKYYNGFNGTSASAPIAAGIAALIISSNPEITAKEVINLIKNSAEKSGPANTYDSNGFSKYYGYGKIDAENAVKNSKNSEYLKEPSDTSNPENDDDAAANDSDNIVNDTTPQNDSDLNNDNAKPENDSETNIDTSNPENDSFIENDGDNSVNPDNSGNDSSLNPVSDEEAAPADETTGCGCSLIF